MGGGGIPQKKGNPSPPLAYVLFTIPETDWLNWGRRKEEEEEKVVEGWRRLVACHAKNPRSRGGPRGPGINMVLNPR